MHELSVYWCANMTLRERFVSLFKHISVPALSERKLILVIV